jgi:cytoskeletal protein CcmA (bactofilin family)
MFNSKPDNDLEPFAPPEANDQKATSPRTATLPIATAATAVAGISVIGTDLTILGDGITIISQSTLQIDGHIRGNVHGRVVLINRGGSVTGEIWAERIELSGAVRGPIVAVNIALHDSARVEGDIMHQKLSISEGAEFDGRARLIKNASDLMPILDAAAIASGKANPYRT